uniref:Protein TIC 214 n=1 Tax=Sedum emarginatum TaxID=516554 RepID=A0A873HQE6_9MAGN|nr:Ycf1 protein [Sedum emarginatum]QOZ39857.1 Ycf1 protein [Sedum emarginatum]
MILTSFLLGNLVALCMKIINSVVVVGLYYGFLTTFSIGPSYLFLLRAQVMEEGTEKKVSATTGFITGQLMMLISIYYAPLHLALGRPHTITVLALPHLLFHFFWNNQKHFFDSRSTNRNSMRNLSIQCVFLNNLIFQLFNYFLLPSSMLARLVNIYMFRCNNKMLFVTSSFVGWLIGHVLFMKWVGLVLVWIRQNRSIRSNVLIRSNKYLVSEVRNSMARIFSIFLFITCVYYLGRIPSSMVLKETSVTEEREESREETDVEIEKTSETKWTKEEEEQEGSTEEDPSPSLFSEEKEDPDKIDEDETEEIRVNGKEKTKDEFYFHFKETCYQNSPVYETSYLDGNQETSKLEILKKKETKVVNTNFLVTLLFDYKRWKRPFRYLKNTKFENSIINEMSQYSFFSYQDNEKKRISFTFPPSLKTFFEMLERKIHFFKSLESVESVYSIFDRLTNSWIYKIEQDKNKLRTEFINRLEGVEKRFRRLDVLTRLRIDQKEYLGNKIDPFLNGPYRGPIKRIFLFSLFSESSIKKRPEAPFINKIHALILFNNFIEFEDIMNISDNKKKALSMGIKEIRKKIPRRSYKLIDEFERQEREYEAVVLDDPGMRSRKSRFGVVFTINEPTYTNYDYEPEQFYLMHYSQQPDFRRNIIMGSMRAQRRKIPILKLSQANAHSPLFLYKLDKSILSYFDIFALIKLIFRNWMKKTNQFELSEKKDKNEKYKTEATIGIETAAEPPNGILTPQITRSCILIIQSTLRKYIILPSLIIAKNISRILLFQLPEWSEDFENWNKETHIKCTYSGVQLSEKDLPKNWLSEGIQIKILFPLYLKPWHRSKPEFPQMDQLKKKNEKNYCFLTVWGRPTKHPFGAPQNQPSFFVPILKELIKKMIKLKTNCFLILKIFKEIQNWINKRGLVLTRLINGPSKQNRILLFGLSELDKWDETKNEKDLIKNNQIIRESPIPTRSKNWTKQSVTEKKMQDITSRTSTIQNQLEKRINEKKKYFRTPDNRLNKKRHAVTRLELKKIKMICQIVKKRISPLIFNSQYFIQFFIVRIYIYIFLVINIIRIKGQLLVDFESQKNKIANSNYNNEATKKETNIEFRNFRQSYFYINKKTSKFFFYLSLLSQAYVGYKLAQSRILNLYHLKFRSALQYHEIALFTNTKLKDNFDVQRIFDLELTNKKLLTSGITRWKVWLQNRYQSKISYIRSSGLVPKKWKKNENRQSIRQNEKTDLATKWDLYEKDRLICYEKQITDSGLNSLSNHKGNLQKSYRNDLLSYKSISSDIFVLPSQVNNNRKISYNYNTNKKRLFILGDKNYLEEKVITDMYKSFFYYRILHLCLRKRVDIEAWIPTNPQNTKIRNYQLIEQLNKTPLINFPTHQTPQTNPRIQNFLNWLGMNEEFAILNEELWFLPELILLYNVYKLKLWIIPIKSLLFNLNEKIRLSDKTNIALKQKWNLASVLLNQEKDVSDWDDFLVYSVESDIKKRINKNNTEEDLDFLLTSHLLVQLRWSFVFNLTLMKNIKVYCLLLSLRNPRESALSAIQRGTINLDIMPSHKYVTDWMERGVFFIEPVRMSIKNPGQFLMYQTIRISLVPKKNFQNNPKYPEKMNFSKSLAQEQKIFGNLDRKNYSLVVVETLLSPRRRKELRILISFNSKKIKGINLNLVFDNTKNVKIYGPVLVESNHLDRLKFFLWPTCQLEDLVCMNRYWFNTNTGSFFSMLRIHMYP